MPQLPHLKLERAQLCNVHKRTRPNKHCWLGIRSLNPHLLMERAVHNLLVLSLQTKLLEEGGRGGTSLKSSVAADTAGVGKDSRHQLSCSALESAHSNQKSSTGLAPSPSPSGHLSGQHNHGPHATEECRSRLAPAGSEPVRKGQ